MGLPPADFKSAASTISPPRRAYYHLTTTLPRHRNNAGAKRDARIAAAVLSPLRLPVSPPRRLLRSYYAAHREASGWGAATVATIWARDASYVVRAHTEP